MAIEYNSSASSGFATTNATSITWSHSCSGTDRILIVGCLDSSSSTTSATYNGVSMTKIDELLITGNESIYLFYLLNPPEGTYNCVVSGGSAKRGGMSTSFTGVKQSSQPNSSNKGVSSSTKSLTISTTTTDDNCWLVGIGYSGNELLAGTNTTLRGSSTKYCRMLDTNSQQTPAGSKSMNITQGTASFSGMILAAISPSIKESNSSFLSLM